MLGKNDEMKCGSGGDEAEEGCDWGKDKEPSPTIKRIRNPLGVIPLSINRSCSMPMSS